MSEVPCTDVAKTEANLNVAFVGNYVPRKCGIATFTHDLTTWVIRALGGRPDVFVVAMNDKREGYDYNPIVRMEVMADDPEDYIRAANYIQSSEADLVCLQHQFGIYGGPGDIYIADFMRLLNKPIVTTLHTVLPELPRERKDALMQVVNLSEAIVVMNYKSIEFLKTYYGANPNKLSMIHHGVPNVQFSEPNEHKEHWGLQGKTVLLNFGLLKWRKGIEYVIEAMPEITKRFPNTVLVIQGETHPTLLKKEGESYRDHLKRKAQDLLVEDSVVFLDRFLSIEELHSILCACDIYVNPYPEKERIVSGTLAYAIGLGRPVVSTPYYHAEELLTNECGVIVEFRDHGSLAKGVLSLLEDNDRTERMRNNAYMFGRKMIWEEVAKRYVECFKNALGLE